MAAAAGSSDDKGQLAVRTEGAFLFTSESVNEGHPGESDRWCTPSPHMFAILPLILVERIEISTNTNNYANI